MELRMLRAGKQAWIHFLAAVMVALAVENAEAILSPDPRPDRIGCELSKPGVRVSFDVSTKPAQYSVAAATLRGMTQGHSAIAMGEILGLTDARFKATVRVNTVFSELPNGKLCVSPSYEAKLDFEQMSVYLASELSRDKCAQEHVLNHEMMHVLFYRQALQQASQALEKDLILNSTNFVVDDETSLPQIQARLSEVVGNHAQSLFKRFDVWHATIDTPHEYERALHVCNGVIPRLLGRTGTAAAPALHVPQWRAGQQAPQARPASRG
ncbi:hypothetical protein [Lacisediminimonas profundi]|uniref:hypothetical protein n=1 Tax=Lacisediminimonas profundi TaxID=2603856 RepID=UPI00124B01D8|nr:hypothetical protein [Lacisediminimonas profundi]